LGLPADSRLGVKWVPVEQPIVAPGNGKGGKPVGGGHASERKNKRIRGYATKKISPGGGKEEVGILFPNETAPERSPNVGFHLTYKS